MAASRRVAALHAQILPCRGETQQTHHEEGSSTIKLPQGRALFYDHRSAERPKIHSFGAHDGLNGPALDPAYPHDTKALSKILGEAVAEGRVHEQRRNWSIKYANHGNVTFPMFDLSTRTPIGLVQVSDIEDVTRILKKEVRKPASYETGALGEGVLSQSDKVRWAAQRANLRPAFTAENLSRLMPVVLEGANALAERIGELAHKGEIFDLWEELSFATFLAIGHAALGETTSFLTERAAVLRGAFELSFSNKARTGSDDLAHAQRIMTDFVNEVYSRAERRQRSDDPYPEDSVLGRLLAVDERGVPVLSDVVRHDELITFMFAGHETTANTMSWTFYELSRHPAVMRRVQQDVDQGLAELRAAGRQLGYNDLIRFKYVGKVINETLRLWPAVAIGTFRQLENDQTCKGPNGSTVTIPEGTVCSFPHFVVHRNPQYWDRPEEFDPDRTWNEKAFMPFTRPPRDCLGRNLAMMEMRAFIITLCSQFEFELVDPPQTVGTNVATLAPTNGLRVRARYRR